MQTILFGPAAVLAILLAPSVPLAYPPLPEDAGIVRAAPEQCLWYLSSAGTAAPSPSSGNEIERLLLEPEVQHFLRALSNEFDLKAARSRSADVEERAQRASLKLARMALTRPTCAFVSTFGIAGRGVQFTGGIVIHAGERAEAVEVALADISEFGRAKWPDRKADDDPQQDGAGKAEAENARTEQIDTVETETVKADTEKADAVESDAVKPGADKSPQDEQPRDAKKWTHLPAPYELPRIEWGRRGDYVIIGIGPGSAEEIARRIEKPGLAPGWLLSLRRRLPVARRSVVQYLNAKEIIDMAAPLAGGLRGRVVMNAFGVGNVNYLASVSGFDSKGAVTKAIVALDGEPQGLLSFLAGEPLASGDLAPIPKDATLAIALKADLSKFYRNIRATLEATDPRALQEFDREMQQFKQEFEVDLAEDLLSALGDSWRVYSSPSEGGAPPSSLVGVVSVRDPQRLAVVLETLATSDELKRELGGMATSEFAGEQIFSLRTPAAVAPSWCFCGKELIVALYPQAIKAHLARGMDGGSLNERGPIVREFNERSKPLAIAYADTPAIFPWAYALMQLASPTLFTELRKNGVELDVAVLPSAPAIARHLAPSTLVISRTAVGLFFTQRSHAEGVDDVPPRGSSIQNGRSVLARARLSRSVANP